MISHTHVTFGLSQATPHARPVVCGGLVPRRDAQHGQLPALCTGVGTARGGLLGAGHIHLCAPRQVPGSLLTTCTGDTNVSLYYIISLTDHHPGSVKFASHITCVLQMVDAVLYVGLISVWMLLCGRLHECTRANTGLRYNLKHKHMRSQVQLGQLSGPQLAQLLWSCVALRIRPPADWLDSACAGEQRIPATITAHCPPPPALNHRGHCRGLAWATRDLCAAGLEAHISECGAGDVVDACWALARLRFQPSARWEQATCARVRIGFVGLRWSTFLYTRTDKDGAVLLMPALPV
jgi:hypothetical protein